MNRNTKKRKRKENKKFPYKSRNMNKKILLLMIGFVFIFGMIASVSAISMDYQRGLNGNSDLKVDFSKHFLGVNFLWKTSDLGTAELKSHPSVNYIKKVGTGNQVTMFYDFNFRQLYPYGLGEVTFTDKRTGRQVNRNYEYVYWGTESYQQPTYNCINSISLNGTISKSCNQNGTITKTRMTWIPYNSRDIPKGNIRIGIRVNVKVNDYIDGVWDIAGKKVDKHASWTESLNTDLVSYYKLDGTSGAVTDSAGSNDGTNNGATRGATGKIGNAFEFNETSNDYVNLSLDEFIAGDWTVNLWVYDDGGSGDNTFISSGSEYSQDKGWSIKTTSSSIHLVVGNNPSVISAGGVYNTWKMITLIHYSNSSWVLKRNTGTLGSAVDTESKVYDANTSIAREGLGTGNLDGKIDGVGIWNRSLSSSEVTQLYNGGSGISYPASPIITLNSPANATGYSTLPTIDFNATVSDYTPLNVSLYLNGNLNETNTSGDLGDYIFTKSITTEGNHNWTIEACNVNGCSTDTRYFTVDTHAPTINITSPTGTFNYLYSNYNMTLNFTASDNQALSSCWFNYNNTNTIVSCSNATLVSRNLTINNYTTVTTYANDSIGNLASDSVTWSYDLFDFNNYTYDSSITESSPTTFTGNFQTGSPISSSYLEYNNTNYSTSISSLGGNRYTLSKTVTSPTVSSDTNISWNFWVNGINATSYNQTVSNINLDNCSSYTNTIFNYTLSDEEDQTVISDSNSTIEATLILRTSGGEKVTEFNQKFKGNSNPKICSETNLNSSGLKIWEQSRYGATNYVYESHNLQNVSMTSLPYNAVLLDLLSADATTFRITYKSNTFLPVPNVIIDIQRKYLGEGVYKSIESPITDANGQSSGSFDLNAVNYRILAKQNGTTTATFENPAIACSNILTGDCNINLNEKQSVNLINTYDSINDFNYGLTQNNRTISLTFDIPSGTPKNVQLIVNQTSILGNKTSCNQTTLASSGKLDCTVSNTLGDVFTEEYIYVNGRLLTSGSSQILEDRSTYFGTNNIILTFILVLSLVLLMVSDAIAVLVGVLIGLIGSTLMLFLNAGSPFGKTSVLIYVIIIIILLIVKISSREGRR